MIDLEKIADFNCHNCKANQPLVLPWLEQLIKEGKFASSMPMGSKVQNSVIMDPSKPPTGLTVPMITAVWDICGKCGTEYIREVYRREAPITMKMPGQGPPGQGPGGLFGGR